MQVLIAIDGSKEALLAMRAATRLLSDSNRHLDVLYVAAKPRPVQSGLLEHHAGVTTLLRKDDPANEILSEAEQGEYDLVVLAASGSTDLKHTMLGSVSSKVAWTVQGSVLLMANWS